MIRGKSYTCATDIWSTGVLLYALVVGSLPFDDTNFQRLLHKIVESDPFYPLELSSQLNDLLHKLLAKNPDERITLDGIKSHPWFSQTESNVMVQLTREEVEHWRRIDGVATEETIDRELIEVMQSIGIDCTGLEEALLSHGNCEGHPHLAMYRILRRNRINEGMRNLMHRVVTGVLAQAKAKKLQQPAQRGSVSLLPPLGSVLPRGKAVGPAIVLGGPRRLSRPVAMRKMSDPLAVPLPKSHETP
jgi:hypothetical protein